MSCSAAYGVALADDDAVDDAVGRRVVAALEARQIEQHHVRVARRELHGPHLLRAVGRVVLRPHVVDVERVLAARDLVLEVAREVRRVARDRAHARGSGSRAPGTPRGCRGSAPDPSGTAAPTMQDRDAVLAPRPSRGSRGPSPAGRARTARARACASLVRVIALVLGDAEARAPGLEHAARREVQLGEGERRVEVLDAARARRSRSPS